MSDNINENRMMYVGQVPWHGKGKARLTAATSKEALIDAGLDYKVELQPMYTKDNVRIPYGKVVVRADSGLTLGVVGNSYVPVQNVDAFEFFDSVVATKQAIYHTAGALGNGERVWILAKLPDSIVVKGLDVVDKYLLLVNSHDGKLSFKMYFTIVRVVCENTLNMSAQDAMNMIRIRHVGDIKDKVAQARNVLGLVNTFYDDFAGHVDGFANYKMTASSLDSYLKMVLFGDTKVEPERLETPIMSERINQLKTLFEKGKGNDNIKVRHTLWAAMNAVTEYVDHYQVGVTEKGGAEKRLKNSWFGVGSRMKVDAYNQALALIV